MGQFNYEKLIREKRVGCAGYALNKCGLVYYNSLHMEFITGQKKLDAMSFTYFTFHYSPEPVDYEYCVRVADTNPLLLLPTKERALVECIKHLNWMDEGLLIEGLQSYLEDWYDEPKLRDAAEHFSVPWETIEYWLEEAVNDHEV